MSCAPGSLMAHNLLDYPLLTKTLSTWASLIRYYDQMPGIFVWQEGQVPSGVSRFAVTMNPMRAMSGSLQV